MKTHSRGKKSAFNRLSVLLRQGKIKTLCCIITGEEVSSEEVLKENVANICISSKEDFNSCFCFQLSIFRELHGCIISPNAISGLLSIFPVKPAKYRVALGVETELYF